MNEEKKLQNGTPIEGMVPVKKFLMTVFKLMELNRVSALNAGLGKGSLALNQALTYT